MSNGTMRGLFSGLLIFLMLATAANAQWVGVVVGEAQLNDIEIEPYAWTRLSLERDQEIELELHIEAFVDAEDVEITARITGYEYSDIEPIRATIGPFDFETDTTYIKRMTLKLPDDIEQGDYKLRLQISDKDNFQSIVEYNLQLDVPRHLLKIEDVLLSPGSSVEAGTALLASVRVENKGEKEEKDVKVTVSIPELGIKASEYIDELEAGDNEEETEELYLKLPRCADAGEYLMKIDVVYNNGHDQASAVTKVNVLENPACAPEEPVVIVQQPEEPVAEPVEEPVAAPSKSKLRTALEIILVVLICLLVLVGLVIGFSRMRSDE